MGNKDGLESGLPPPVLWREWKGLGPLQGWMSEVFAVACSQGPYQALFLVRGCWTPRDTLTLGS